MARRTTAEIYSLLEQAMAQIKALAQRVEKLESGNGRAQPAIREAAPAVAVQAPPQPRPEPIRDEDLLAISAALGAFFGERVHVRQIRLIASPAWAQQGRVWIQASHRLH